MNMAVIMRLMAGPPNCNKTAINICSLPSPASAQTTDYLTMVLNIVFGIAASVAVLMIAINGFRYITARGEPSATASAKDGILYSVVGLLVTMVAYSIVIFVTKALG